MECCSKTANAARFGLRHATMHMVADLRDGDTIFVGERHRKIKITEILTPFKYGKLGDVVKTAKGSADVGDVMLTFKHGPGSQVKLDIENSVGVKWGLKGHFRNSHKPVVEAASIM